MPQNFLYLFANFIFYGILAFILIKRITPQLPKRGETNEQFIDRIYQTSQDTHHTAKNKYGNFRQTIQVHSVNMILLFGICVLSNIYSQAVNIGLAYLSVGLVVIKILGAPHQRLLKNLGWKDRIWLRVFHAWFWPLYLWAKTSLK